MVCVSLKGNGLYVKKRIKKAQVHAVDQQGAVPKNVPGCHGGSTFQKTAVKNPEAETTP